MPTIEDLNQEGSREIVQGHLRKIVEIYDPEWIVAHELIQNAVDAIQANDRVDTEGRVEVEFDLSRDAVTVHDNGTGFEFNLDLLRPGGTGAEKRLRSRSPTKGYQGVGLKAVMYSTQSFLLETQTPDKRWKFAVDNLAAYIDPGSEEVPEYDLDVEDATSRETYTTIVAQFGGGRVRDLFGILERMFLDEDTVRWQELYRKEREESGSAPAQKYLEHFLGWYFRTFTYVGCYNALLNVPVKNPDTETDEAIKATVIALRIVWEDDDVGVGGKLGAWLESLEERSFETELPYRAWDYAAVALENDRREDRYRLAPEVITRKPTDDEWDTFKPTYRDKLLELRLTPNFEVDEFRERYGDFVGILERPGSRVALEDYSDVIAQITGIYVVIGRTSHFELLGVQNRGQRMIASNGTPTAHSIEVRSTSSTWYLETMHVVVNLDSTLNIGKRHLANSHLVGRVREFVEACYPKLVSISRLFVEREPRGDVTEDLPAVIDLEVLAREGVPFRRFPSDEDALIGIFSCAIAQLRPDFSVYGFFGKAIYDGKFLWDRTPARSDNDLRILEFKVKLGELVKEFAAVTHDKEFTAVSLVIVWDRRVDYPGWTVKGLSRTRLERLERQGVPTDLVEYVLEDPSGDFRPLICVADLLQRIPLEGDPEDGLDEFVRSMH